MSSVAILVEKLIELLLVFATEVGDAGRQCRALNCQIDPIFRLMAGRRSYRVRKLAVLRRKQTRSVLQNVIARIVFSQGLNHRAVMSLHASAAAILGIADHIASVPIRDNYFRSGETS